MRASTTAALLLISCTCSAAVPLAKDDTGVRTVQLTKRLRRSAPAPQRYDSHARQAADKERDLEKRAQSLLIGDLHQDIQYFGSVDVGTPGYRYEVILDTGSADMLLATTPCEHGCRPDTPVYHPLMSNTSQATDESFAVQFGTGAATGTLVRDKVSIAGLTVPDQMFGACSNLSNVIEYGVSGLLGLGWQSLATSKSTPLVQRLWQEGQLDEPVFAFALARWNGNANATSDVMPGGLMTLGGINSSLFHGDINWIPLTSRSYWEIPIESLSIGGVPIELELRPVAIDTGTSLIGVPAEAARSIYARIPGSRQHTETFYTFPCDTAVDLSLTFDGQTYPVDPRDFSNGRITPESNDCLGAVFVLSQAHAGKWIIGDAFLKNVYSAFRFTPPSVGFAKLRGRDETLQSLGPVPKANAPLLNATNFVNDAVRPSSAANTRADIAVATVSAAVALTVALLVT
ncbi:hypothetical protein ACM66B_000796 [Microbotryomycetes sp. NB124-2]